MIKVFSKNISCRLGTFIHLVAITELWNPISTKQINQLPKNESGESISTLIQIRRLQEYGLLFFLNMETFHTHYVLLEEVKD